MASAESSVPLLADMQSTNTAKDVLDEPLEVSPAATASFQGYDPAEMEGLTLCEKKFILINREIDANGMGRYQW